MRADGIIKAVKGVTAMDEVLRLTRSEDVGMALAEGADSLINLGSKM